MNGPLVNLEWVKVSIEIVLDPHNLTLWQKLIATAEKNGEKGIHKAILPQELSILRSSYESMLKKFPLLHNYWIKYANWEFKLGNILIAEEIYSSGLKPLNHSIELWTSYLSFKVNTISNNLPQILSLFEKARFIVGSHFHSFEFYKLYLKFLQNYLEIDTSYLSKYFILLRIILEIPIYHYEYFFKLMFEKIADVGKSQVLKNKYLGYLLPPSELQTYTKYDLKTTAVNLKKIFVDVYTTTQYKVYELYHFEKSIIPYFDREYLSQQQLSNWDRYIEFLELKQYPVELAYERCLISTASYSQFWIKYADYYIVQKKFNTAAELLVKGCFFCNDYKFIIKLIEILIYLNQFLRAKDIVTSYIQNNISVPIPIYEKLLNLERLISNDDTYIINLFRELIKETKLDWFFQHLLYYSIPIESKKTLFKEFESIFQNSKIYKQSWEKLNGVKSIFPEIDYKEELKLYT